jgi:hypothetical protein
MAELKRPLLMRTPAAALNARPVCALLLLLLELLVVAPGQKEGSFERRA